MKKYSITMNDGYAETLQATCPDNAIAKVMVHNAARLENWPLTPEEWHNAIHVQSIELVEV